MFFFASVEQIPLRWSMGMLSDSFLHVLQISLDPLCKEEIVRFDSSFLHFTRLMSNWTITNYSTHSCFTDLVDPQHYLVSYSISQMPAGWKVREVECMIREVWRQCSSVCRLIRPSEMSRDTVCHIHVVYVPGSAFTERIHYSCNSGLHFKAGLFHIDIVML